LQNSVQVEVETPPGWIGVSTKRSTTGGAIVTAVVPNGPAANAGIKVGDVIQALNGTNVKDEDFEAEISTFKPGTKILITYLRSAWAHETLLTVSKNTI
jgi:S1-C subfamily serine protease